MLNHSDLSNIGNDMFLSTQIVNQLVARQSDTI